MQAIIVNQWGDSENLDVFSFVLHNCGNDAGFQIVLMGLGFGFYFQI